MAETKPTRVARRGRIFPSNGLELPVDAMLDTGFSYWLAIDNQDIDALNWIPVRKLGG